MEKKCRKRQRRTKTREKAREISTK
jgi:hypothetical protein